MVIQTAFDPQAPARRLLEKLFLRGCVRQAQHLSATIDRAQIRRWKRAKDSHSCRIIR